MNKKFLISKSVFFVIITLSMFSIFGCEEQSTEPVIGSKKNGFISPEEYMQNPSVKSAINESHIPVNIGESFPALTGTYDVSGSVTSTSSTLSGLVDKRVDSIIRLYEQTTSGKIKFQETIGGISAEGIGGYITGSNGKFTIWQESIQQGEKAGLPSDLTIYISLIISGVKNYNGDLTVKTLAVLTNAKSNNSGYNLSNIIGSWWMTSLDMELNK